jgi:hypothetical protein
MNIINFNKILDIILLILNKLISNQYYYGY